MPTSARRKRYPSNGSPTTPQKRTAHKPKVVTPSPSKRQKKGDDTLKCKDITFYICRFRHSHTTRDVDAKKEFPPETEIMQKLRQLASGGNGKSSCSTLRDFIMAYGVERNFRGMTAQNVQPLLPIVQHLQALPSVGLDATLDPSAVVREVNALADLCKRQNFARNLSFASKALNMMGHNVPIYSSECKAYLGKKSCTSYGQYLSEWMQEFQKDRSVYEDEAAKIIQGYCELEKELGPTWFAMRGLDQTMCRMGAPKQKQLLCPACQDLAQNNSELSLSEVSLL